MVNFDRVLFLERMKSLNAWMTGYLGELNFHTITVHSFIGPLEECIKGRPATGILLFYWFNRSARYFGELKVRTNGYAITPGLVHLVVRIP